MVGLNHLKIQRDLMEIKFNSFEKVLESIDKQINEQRKGILRPIMLKSDVISPEDEEEIAEKNWEIDKYVEIIYSSFFVSIYSLFENNLLQICRNVKRQGLSVVDIEDLKGRPLERAKILIEKYAKFKIVSVEEWEEMTIIQKIRNVIVHNNGRIYKDAHAKFLKKYSEKVKGFTITRNNDVDVNYKYCCHCLEIVRGFFDNFFRINKM